MTTFVSAWEMRKLLPGELILADYAGNLDTGLGLGFLLFAVR